MNDEQELTEEEREAVRKVAERHRTYRRSRKDRLPGEEEQGHVDER